MALVAFSKKVCATCATIVPLVQKSVSLYWCRFRKVCATCATCANSILEKFFISPLAHFLEQLFFIQKSFVSPFSDSKVFCNTSPFTCGKNIWQCCIKVFFISRQLVYWACIRHNRVYFNGGLLEIVNQFYGPFYSFYFNNVVPTFITGISGHLKD